MSKPRFFNDRTFVFLLGGILFFLNPLNMIFLEALISPSDFKNNYRFLWPILSVDLLLFSSLISKPLPRKILAITSGISCALFYVLNIGGFGLAFLIPLFFFLILIIAWGLVRFVLARRERRSTEYFVLALFLIVSVGRVILIYKIHLEKRALKIVHQFINGQTN